MNTSYVVVDSSTVDFATADQIYMNLVTDIEDVVKVDLIHARISAFNTKVTVGTDYVIYIDVDELGSQTIGQTERHTFCLPVNLNSASELYYMDTNMFEQSYHTQRTRLRHFAIKVKNINQAPIDISGLNYTFIFRVYHGDS